jgi:hypothetical protein
MPEEITLPTLSKIGLKMDCGIESSASIVARFILCGMILLRVKVASKKVNKYTFWSFRPRFSAKNMPFGVLTHAESVVCLMRKM